MSKKNTRQKRANKQSRMEKGQFILPKLNPRIIVGCIAFALCLGYIAIMNSIATEGFRVSELQNRLSDAQETHRKLLTKSAELQSLTRVEIRSADLALVEASNVGYLRPVDELVVALKTE